MHFLSLFLFPPDAGLIRFDTLAVIMVVLVSFLGVIIIRFAARYLEGDPKRSRFLIYMTLSLLSVVVLVISNHLLLLLAAWVAVSLFLHKLLLHHPDRSGAVFAARKKFVFSRLAELSFLAAALLLHSGHDTWRIDELVSSITAGNHAGLPAAAFLIVFTAMLKSAQFPFHSWLPDTMDTPTPVSAFMHAGIINAGGFIVLRFAPVFTAAPSALHLLAVVGTLTAVFGAIVMLAQTGVKRALAFSTIAQMGFMMIQIGLGAWGLALLHLVAHSLYKAFAFLQAGSTIGAAPRAAIPLGNGALALGTVAGTVMVFSASGVMHYLFPATVATPMVFLVILSLALAYGIARATSAYVGSLPRALAVALSISVLALTLHFTAVHLLSTPAPPPVPMWLWVFVGVAFVMLFFFQALLWRASAHPLGRKLFVHALSGFYVGTVANRFLNGLWPSRKSQ